MMVLRTPTVALLALTASLAAREPASPSVSPPDILPLDSVHQNQTGTWRTVVEGNQIETFNLEILGIAPNFAGPGQAIIIAKATDPSQILSGPVAGMSGSPCYIGDKLIGAYAYGFTWPKEQAIIGITPIEDMFPVLGASSSVKAAPMSTPGPVDVNDLPRPSQMLDRAPEKAAERTVRLAGGESLAGLQPTPTPLLASGVSERALGPFRPYAEAMGLSLMSAPVGNGADLGPEAIQPGSPMAGVLLDGDFDFVAVGTCTWREGDRILGFGHPFLQGGAVDIPLAPAEVLTVVQTLPSSFKLANAGPVVGSIYQDRLTAVAGEIGRAPARTDYRVVVTAPDGSEKTYAGKLFRHEDLSPMLAVIGFLQSTLATLESADNQSYVVRVVADYAGYAPLEMVQAGDGIGGLYSVAFDTWDMLGMLASNPFEEARLDSLRFEVAVHDRRESAVMDRLQRLSGPVQAGETAEVAVGWRSFRGENRRDVVRVPVPEGTAGERLSLFIGDAESADRIDRGGRWLVSSFGELLDYFRSRRDNQRLYVKLLRPAPGVHTGGKALYDLPPSARSLLESPRTVEPRSALREITLWESSLELPGAFRGSDRFPLTVEPR